MLASSVAPVELPSRADARLAWALLAGVLFFAAVVNWALDGAGKADLGAAARQFAAANPHHVLRQQVARLVRAIGADCRWVAPSRGDLREAPPVAPAQAARGIAVAERVGEGVDGLAGQAEGEMVFPPAREAGVLRKESPAVPPPRRAA
jgi:hypothetical protein